MNTDPATTDQTRLIALTATVADQAAALERLRALVVDVVVAGFAAPPPGWLPDDLWARLVAETPKPETYTRPAAADPDDGHALF